MRHILLFALALGCSSEAKQATRPVSGSRSIELIAKNPALAARVSPAGEQAHAMEARIPRRASEPLHLEVRGASLDVAPLDVRDVEAHETKGATELDDVAVDTDIVHLHAGVIEELRVLRSPRAPSIARWRIGKNGRISEVRVRDGRIEGLDAQGVLRIGSAPVAAFDASGAALPVTVTLDGDVLTIAAETSGARYPVVIDPLWNTVGSLAGPRYLGYLAPLPSGKAILFGGTSDGTTGLTTCEIFNPATNTWSAGPALAYSYDGYQAVPLSDGRVLTVGGIISGVGLSTEIYSEPANAWKKAATIPCGSCFRSGGAAALLPSGKVMLVGGQTGADATDIKTWIYDPAGDTWTAGPNIAQPRANASTLTVAGKMILFGGENTGVALSSSEIYNPATNAFSAGPNTKYLHTWNYGVVLPSGKGIVGTGSAAGAEIYDGVANTWTATSAAPNGSSGRAVLLTTGNVLMGTGTDFYIYNPTADRWLPAGSTNHYGGGSVALSNGRALFAGGAMGSSTWLSTADIYAPAATGSTCATGPASECTAGGDCGSRCLSMNCVDGVCCNTACTGSCQACSETGSVGTCTSVSGTPRGTRTCAPYASCTSGACATSCSSDTACTTGNFCDTGACKIKRANGLACTGANQCASGNCVDGVCCNVACGGQCEACDVPGSAGTCSPVSGAPHGSRTACGGTGAGTACGQTCDGVTTASCKFPGTSSPCGTNTCNLGIETHASTCNGAGSCSDVPKSCGGYNCGGSTCRSTCAVDSHCIAGYYCKSGACVAVEGLGTDCADGTTCTTKFCVDGVCCGVASCDAGSSCGNAGHKGTCSKSPGTACAGDVECGSGHCVDGVCCDSACSGQCQACNVTGKAGTCSPVTGDPVAPRAACNDGGGDVCKKRACDGVADHVTSCVGFASGTTVACGPSACSEASFTAPSTCDGAGACKAPAPTSCAPYACNTSGCLASCASDTDCATGHRCDAGKCVQKNATCSADGLSSTAAEGGAPTSCLPYRCGEAGKCLTECSSTADCASGNLCDVGSRTCAPQAEDTGSSGGCSFGARSSGSVEFAWVFALVGAVMARRRAALAMASLLGCSRGESVRETRPAALSIVRSVPTFAKRVGPAMQIGELKPMLQVTVPRRASVPLGLAAGGASLQVLAELARDAAAVVEGNASTLADVDVDTDVVHLSLPGEVEELRVLRSPRAPSTLRWTLSLSPELTDVRVREHRVEVFAGERLVVSALPMVSVDAHGVRRDLEPRIERRDAHTFAMTVIVDPSGVAYPLVVDPAWTAGPTMLHQRGSHSSTTLPSGKVLIAGSDTATLSGNGDSTSEVYDPATNTFGSLANLSRDRYGHTAYLMGTTKVLIAGGVARADGCTGVCDAASSTADLYDIATNAWTETGAMTTEHEYTASAQLKTGQVLIAGGATAAYSVTGVAELYTLATGKWTSAGSMPTARYGATATTMNDGRVLVVGGETTWGTSSTSSVAEIYNPTTNTWSAAASMAAKHSYTTSVLLADGRVLVIGAPSEVYDPTTNKWSNAGNGLTIPSGAVRLPSGNVLAVSGGVSQVWVPANNAWGSGAGMPSGSGAGEESVALFGGNKVLVAGGRYFDGMWHLYGTTNIYSALANGTSCSGDAECSTGSCVDGVCCNTSCTGACSACAETGTVGTCSAISGAPHTGKTCGAYVCNAGACRTTCAVDSDCSLGNYCSSGACKPVLANGTACPRSTACTSGNCVDGVCCDTACNNQCEACAETGSVGTCVGVNGTPRGTRTACSGVGAGTTCGIRCDVSNRYACIYPSISTPCGMTACSGGVETHATVCNGSGACGDKPVACGGYKCDTSACKTKCTGDVDCVPGFFCKSGACEKSADTGMPCTAASMCSSGFCTDGVCCAAASCGAGESCATETPGLCKKKDGTACASGAECGSTFCADGYCCATKCDGQCEACDMKGAEGTCAPVTGEPKNGRAACDAGSDACSVRECDGIPGHTATCQGYKNGTSVPCKDAACMGASFVPASSCDGAGACKVEMATSCLPYDCDAKGCLHSCTTSDQCAMGYQCSGSTCVPAGATCSPDGASSIPKDGTPVDCAPYLCNNDTGECRRNCEDSSQCSSGNACEPTKSTCEQSASGESGGCTQSRARSSFGFVALLVACAAVARRRRV